MKKKVFVHPPRRVALFVTCMVDMMYPNVGMATVELLDREGVEVYFPEEQTCCGQPAFNAGYRDEAVLLARRFIDIFEPLIHNGNVDAVVAPSGSCVTMTSHFYRTLFEANPNDPYLIRAERLAAATFELTEFLVDVLGVTDVGARVSNAAGSEPSTDVANRGADSDEVVPTLTYHACCHLLRELRVDAQPRKLLSNVGGAKVVELEESEECCGFGGLFSIKNAGISTAIGQRKLRNITQSGADFVALCDVSCMTHINGLLEKQGQPSRAIHIAEVLNQQHQILDSEQATGQGTNSATGNSTVGDSAATEKKAVGYAAGNSEQGSEAAGAEISRKATPKQPRPMQPKPRKPKEQPQQQRPRRWQDY